MGNKIKVIILSILFGLAVAAWVGFQKYKAFLWPNVPAQLDEKFICIPTNSTFDQVVHLLDSLGMIKDSPSFIEVAKRLKYIRTPMRPGRFEIEPGWNNLTLVRHLRNGKQAPVNLVFTHGRLLEDVAGKVAGFIEADSVALMDAFLDSSYLNELQYTPQTLMALFIPNTYQCYWNTNAKEFLKRMEEEHQRFWDKENRREKAANLGLTETEVYILASIVERETNQNSEKQRMAGVYLNRLKINMLLQADPTCVFATRDFGAKRVLDYHKNFDSPYNTYKYPGLPPGPISMASIPSIDAVLNYENHDYLYFCAKPDGSGFHAFARTLAQHNVNAARYRASLSN